MKIEIWAVDEINGKRADVGVWFKKNLKSLEELKNYKKYLEKKIGKELYITYKVYD